MAHGRTARAFSGKDPSKRTARRDMARFIANLWSLQASRIAVTRARVCKRVPSRLVSSKIRNRKVDDFAIEQPSEGVRPVAARHYRNAPAQNPITARLQPMGFLAGQFQLGKDR